jgi:signal transduction histidine kinase
MIKTVLRNLLSNAVKFTPNEGSITIKAEIVKEVVQIKVSDTGIGLDEKQKTKLFTVNQEKIRSGTEQEQGSGLGLVLCKEFVEKNGGKIWVEPKQAVGSTFAFNIPRYN